MVSVYRCDKPNSLLLLNEWRESRLPRVAIIAVAEQLVAIIFMNPAYGAHSGGLEGGFVG